MLEYKPSICPYCETELSMLNQVLGTGGGIVQPRPGDLTICIICAQILIMSPTLTLQKPAPGVLEARFAEDPRLEAILRAAEKFVRAMDRRPLAERRAARQRQVSALLDEPAAKFDQSRHSQ